MFFSLLLYLHENVVYLLFICIAIFNIHGLVFKVLANESRLLVVNWIYTSVFLKETNEFNQFTSIFIVDHRYLFLINIGTGHFVNHRKFHLLNFTF